MTTEHPTDYALTDDERAQIAAIGQHAQERVADELDRLGLSGFDRWCVRSNLEHAADQGLESILAQLRANGYPSTAAHVEQVWQAITKPKGTNADDGESQ